jgi:hypothetical protein
MLIAAVRTIFFMGVPLSVGRNRRPAGAVLVCARRRYGRLPVVHVHCAPRDPSISPSQANSAMMHDAKRKQPSNHMRTALCRICTVGTSPRIHMGGMAAEAAAKRAFDEHRLAVVMMGFFRSALFADQREPFVGGVDVVRRGRRTTAGMNGFADRSQYVVSRDQRLHWRQNEICRDCLGGAAINTHNRAGSLLHHSCVKLVRRLTRRRFIQ